MGAALTSGFTANNPRAAIGDFFFADGIQGLTLDGQAFDLTAPNAKCNWTPAKDYVAGKVYKVANKPR